MNYLLFFFSLITIIKGVLLIKDLKFPYIDYFSLAIIFDFISFTHILGSLLKIDLKLFLLFFYS